jgi:hypothetical protein
MPRVLLRPVSAVRGFCLYRPRHETPHAYPDFPSRLPAMPAAQQPLDILIAGGSGIEWRGHPVDERTWRFEAAHRGRR